MYPCSIYIGLRVVPKEVVWGQSIYCLGTWTLRIWFLVFRSNEDEVLNSRKNLDGLDFDAADSINLSSEHL